MVTVNLLGTANLHLFRLSVKEVCEICGFSERTFFHRVKAGKIKPSRDEQNRIRDGRPRIYVSADALADYLGITDEAQARERLGLPAIEDQRPEPTPVDHKIFADVPDRRVPDIREPDAFVPREAGFTDDAAENQARWNAGEVTDTAGNSSSGNERWPSKGFVSLIGPLEPKPKKKFDSAEHMNPALIGTSHPVRGIDGELIAHAGSNNHPLVALGRKDEPAPKPRHPNQTRQELLNAIWRDVRNGWSR